MDRAAPVSQSGLRISFGKAQLGRSLGKTVAEGMEADPLQLQQTTSSPELGGASSGTRFSQLRKKVIAMTPPACSTVKKSCAVVSRILQERSKWNGLLAAARRRRN